MRLVGVLAVVGLGLAVGVPAQADPVGSVDLDRVASEPPIISVLGASAAGVLYRIQTMDQDILRDGTTWVKPTGAAPYRVDNKFNRLAGNKVFGRLGVSYPVQYQIIGTPTTIRCDASPQPASPLGTMADVYAPWGWISDDGHRVEASATGCQVTAKYAQLSSQSLAAADDQGFVTVEPVNNVTKVVYRTYANPTTLHVVADGGKALMYPQGFALSGKTVTWSQLDYATEPIRDTSFITRSTVDGSAAPVVTFLDRLATDTSILGDKTGWAGCYTGYDYPPARCSAGTLLADGSRTESPLARTAVSDGSRFLFDTYGASPGIDAGTTINATTRTRVLTIGLVAPEAYSVSLGASGVAYVDTQGPTVSVTRRAYSRSSSSVGLYPQVQVVPETVHRDVGRDGRRTAYIDKSFNVWVVTDDGVRTKVFTAVNEVARASTGLTLSGSRLLWAKAKYTGIMCDPSPVCGPTYHDVVLMLTDLRTNTSTQLAMNSYNSYTSLWGSYLAWRDTSNAIYRKDLSSGQVLQVKAAGGVGVNSLDVHGDYVGWSTCDNNWPCGSSVIAYRNMATRTAAVALASSGTHRVKLSDGHLAYDVQTEGTLTATLKVLRLGTRTTGVVGPVQMSKPFDVFDETLAWINPDGIARIGPNSPYVAPPRYLGNAMGASTFRPGAGQSWQPEFAISKALPTCAITIKSGTTVRRTLSCATSVGTARVFWNGRDSAGRLLPAGKYSWTMTGRDADGTLRWWNGNTAAIAGTVTIA